VDLLTCDAFVPNSTHNTNLAGFCDRRVDAEVGRALKLQTRDPAGADDQWAKVDRMITDRAPLLPLALPQAIDLVSPRVGNFQRHPQWGVLFDQLWVV
jgi:peptide/nickel transport system substrate-binding protein